MTWTLEKLTNPLFLELHPSRCGAELESQNPERQDDAPICVSGMLPHCVAQDRTEAIRRNSVGFTKCPPSRIGYVTFAPYLPRRSRCAGIQPPITIYT